MGVHFTWSENLMTQQILGIGLQYHPNLRSLNFYSRLHCESTVLGMRLSWKGCFQNDRSQRNFTINLYQSRWNIFHEWYKSAGICTWDINGLIFIKFLKWAFFETGSNRDTSIGFRTALSTVTSLWSLWSSGGQSIGSTSHVDDYWTTSTESQYTQIEFECNTENYWSPHIYT